MIAIQIPLSSLLTASPGEGFGWVEDVTNWPK